MESRVVSSITGAESLSVSDVNGSSSMMTKGASDDNESFDGELGEVGPWLDPSVTSGLTR